MSAPAEQWANLTNQESLPGASVPAPQGANLEAPALSGGGPQPTNPGKPPGFVPIHFALVQSFLVGKNPDDLTDGLVDSIFRQAEKLTDKLLANYPEYFNFLPNLGAKVPDSWKR